MFSLLASTVLTASMTVGGHGCCCGSAPAYYQPALATAAAQPGRAPAVAAAPAAGGYRSYSYQPQAAAAPVYQNYNYRRSTMPFYAYPKTDPRRYQHN